MIELIYDEVSRDPFQNCGDVFIYGAGVQCRETIKYLRNREKKLHLVDSSEKKWGVEIDGIPVINPQTMVAMLKSKDIIVIGAVFNQYEIAMQLINDWKVERSKIFMYTCKIFEDDVYCFDLLEQNKDKIFECYAMLEDEESKQYYLNSLKARLSRRPYYLQPNNNMNVIGVYGDQIVGYKENDIILDCGAFTGDTAELYYDSLRGKCKVYAMEPFRESYIKMLDRIKRRNIGEQIVCMNLAVGDKKETACFTCEADDNPMGVTVKKGNGFKFDIQVETIDHLFLEEKINYIKMDIEGWELKALTGAEQVIRKNKPQMMISAYHKITDFWEIPLYLSQIVPDYKIYVGHAPGVSLEMEFYFTV